jgi:hypothetical protein
MDELPEDKVLEFEETIRRLADEERLPTLERFESMMRSVASKVYGHPRLSAPDLTEQRRAVRRGQKKA